MYGANNLVWTGVQNATIGTIYTTEYGFSTAGVAGGYGGGIIGTIIGYDPSAMTYTRHGS